MIPIVCCLDDDHLQLLSFLGDNLCGTFNLFFFCHNTSGFLFCISLSGDTCDTLNDEVEGLFSDMKDEGALESTKRKTKSE